jgi:hypothetical protein
VWSPEGGARYTIVREAANYLLNRHLNISSSSIRAVIDQFDGLLSHRGKGTSLPRYSPSNRFH